MKQIFSLLLVLAFFLFSCKNQKKSESDKSAVNKNAVIEVLTTGMEFQSVDTIPSGWNTFKYVNQSPFSHFFLLDKYPDGKTIEDNYKEIAPPFDKGMEFIMEGKMDEAMAEFGKLPAWYGEVVFTGGSGLISPNHTNTVSVKLAPGLYIMECYVKMNNGKFHTSMGMMKEIHVLHEDSGNQHPEADINITISSADGITYDKEISTGEHTFSVFYRDQIVHENFVGHDVNLVKLDDGADLDELEAWMNWSIPKGLTDPAPKGVTFLGGTNDAPAGTTQYFKANLEPGNYAFISEVPETRKKGMLKTFAVN